MNNTKNNVWHLDFALHASAFLSGFITMALEMLIGRTFVPYFGGTIYTWGALISVFLIGMTLGYVAGGKAADRKPDIRFVASLFGASALAISLVPLYGETLIETIVDSIEDLRYGALLAAIALACLPAGVLAAVGPCCVRLLLDRKDHSGTISGRLSGFSTAGSIVGTLGTTFLFIPSVGVRLIYFVLASVSLGIGGILFLANPGGKRQISVPAGTLGIVSIVVVAALLSSLPSRSEAAQMPTLMTKDGIIERVESEYNTIFVEKNSNYIAMSFGYRTTKYTESMIDLNHRDDLVVMYTRFMTSAFAFDPNPVRKIALVGLGGGRTINYLVSSLPNSTADVAELDPAVIALAHKYFGVDASDRLRIHNKDGRVFLNQSKEKYDLILLDAYRGPFVPFHLTTQEFYRLVKSRLNDGGVVAQNVELTTMLFDSAYATMKSVFDQVDAIDAGDDNVVLVGYMGHRLSAKELMKRAGTTQDRYRMKYDLRTLLNARRDFQPTVGAKILTDDFAPVEMLKTVKRHNARMN